MNRKDLIRHLTNHNCKLLREGGSHSIWQNVVNNRRISIPRHPAIPKFTAIEICKHLEIPFP